ncbi:MAG: glutamyl-tRNA reductase [Candidatus Tectomicrobia bacterium]|nr:glutamyl-tRNA reductase [Candidatus Tectomicrobia bacterium]
MELIVTGISHKRTPVDIREQVHFESNGLRAALLALKNRKGIEEVVLLSTCNRVEVFARVPDFEKSCAAIQEFVGQFHEIPQSILKGHFYFMKTKEMISHLFRVASGLDSMVVGEPQILGQVKDAYREALEAGCTGLYLNHLFEKGFAVAKRVRAETRIGENAVSVSYAAVELARKIFDDIKDQRVLLIGAGEMAELAAQHLVQLGAGSVLVSNRSFERAEALARKFGGRAISFSHIEAELVGADIIISSTGAPHYVIRKELVQRVIRHRRNRPMFFIDIAIPRDVDPAVQEIDNVYVYDLDDLEHVVAANIQEREREAVRAEAMIEKETEAFLRWMETLEVVPTIVSLRERAEAVRQQELEDLRAKLRTLSPEEEQAVHILTVSLVNKLLHAPIAELKKRASTEDAPTYLRVARSLFHLDE